jgi:fimbrial isopeptide formation D2 family protein/LPXTG-motif cell wall-anchored protein
MYQFLKRFINKWKGYTMKRLRNILAIVFSMVLGIGTMMPAFAADAVGLAVDDKVTVTGFLKDDTVTAYKFIEWVDSEGWKVADGVGLSLNDIKELSDDEIATLASHTDKMTLVSTGTSISEENDVATWEMTCGTVATAGSYLILITSGTAEHVYNPVVVSADFDGTNAKAVDLTSPEAAIKKQDVTVTKEADNAPDDYDVQVGDIVPFTVTVTVPQYNTNWTEPFFAVSDELSTGLTIEVPPTIEGLTAGTHYSITKDGQKDDSGFTIQFTDSYLKSNHTNPIRITYSARVGEDVKDAAQVHEETNKVTLEFSNNPSDSSDHKTVDDETHHYTFAIDANRNGQGTEKTNELIKVGVDEDGNQVTVYKEGAETSTGITPLAGAEFTLTGIGANGATGENSYKMIAISDEKGRIFFNNLEVGTYSLEETKAPAGYIKDQTGPHTVVITAKYNADTTLKSYTITIDDEATSTYNATTNAENVIIYQAPANGNDVFPINNKKGTELPSTGGIGTTIFYIVGGGMVAGAVVFLLTKRRIAGNE